MGDREVQYNSVQPIAQKLSHELTKTGSLSLSKALLGNVDDQYSALQLYRIYFESLNLLASDSNVSALNRFPDAHQQIRRQAFRVSEPHKEPEQFQFFLQTI